MTNLVGVTHGALGDHRRALEYHERAIVVVKNILGENHPTTAQFMINKAITLSNLNRGYEANELIDGLLKKLPKDHSKYVELQRQKQELAQRVPGAHRQKLNNKGKKKRP